jgi:hypothetical protein
MAHRDLTERPTPRTVPVDRADLEADGTHLALRDGRELHVNAFPDPSGSHRVATVLRRIERVDLTVDDRGVRSSVTGVGHRLRRRVPVAVATALSLVLDGVPSAVTVSTRTDRVQVVGGRS